MRATFFDVKRKPQILLRRLHKNIGKQTDVVVCRLFVKLNARPKLLLIKDLQQITDFFLHYDKLSYTNLISEWS